MKKKTVSVQGLRFTGFEEDYVFQTIEKTQDFYESALLRQWSPLVPSPGTILDVGANLGNHTLFWSRFFPEAEIVSLEPLPENYECLCQNVTDNALSRVRPLRAAAGEKEGFVRVAGFNPENLGATSFQYSDSGDEQTAVVRTLDSVGEELRLSGIGLVKIDTEGFELSVLRGMEGILDRDRPVLWIECGPETVPGVLRILKGKAYLPIRLEGANLLFFPEEKSPEAELGTEQLLSVSLTLLDKVNRYFQNYETSKKWLESKDRQLSSVREQLSRSKEEGERSSARARAAEKRQEDLSAQLTGISADRDRLSRKLEETAEENRRLAEKASLAEREKASLTAALSRSAGELEEVRQAYSQLQQRCDGYRARLEKDAALLAEEQTLLSALRRQLQQLNGQLLFARQQNAEYTEKLNKVYGTWYGRIALRTYKALKKLKHFILRK